MTIRRGDSWGITGPRDGASPVARTDRELHDRFREGAAIVHLEGGDLAKALGASVHAHSASANVTIVPIDTYEVTWTSADGSVSSTQCHSHCVHGGWWREESWWFSAGGFVDDREILPRTHPNDGIAEVLHVSASMSLRQRYGARKRLRWGTHLPHPDLAVVRGTSLAWEAKRSMPLVIDAVTVGHAVTVRLVVVPDARRVSIAAAVQ